MFVSLTSVIAFAGSAVTVTVCSPLSFFRLHTTEAVPEPPAGIEAIVCTAPICVPLSVNRTGTRSPARCRRSGPSR